MKDYFGQELNIGDTVIYGTTMSQGRGFNVGVIEKFTPKQVTVRNTSKKGMVWIKDKTEKLGGHWNMDGYVCNNCYPDQLCKIDSLLVTYKMLMK